MINNKPTYNKWIDKVLKAIKGKLDGGLKDDKIELVKFY